MRKLIVTAVVGKSGWRDRRGPQRAVVTGLNALGHDVYVTSPGRWPVTSVHPDVVFLWNGAKGDLLDLTDRFRRQGAVVMVMERGFFDRGNYTQIDHAGFNHTASWRDLLTTPAPRPGALRLAAVWPEPPRSVEARPGYILVLGQVSDDAQLADSEISRAQDLLDLVVEAAPADADIRFRPHPWVGKPIDLRGGASRATGSLREAIDAAAFIVTINSNAGNEALAWGCPVLCLGPALYATAGAAARTTVREMSSAIAAMLGGWQPREDVVENYLQWLACRQYSAEELAAGDVLAALIDTAHQDREHTDV